MRQNAADALRGAAGGGHNPKFLLRDRRAATAHEKAGMIGGYIADFRVHHLGRDVERNREATRDGHTCDAAFTVVQRRYEEVDPIRGSGCELLSENRSGG